MGEKLWLAGGHNAAKVQRALVLLWVSCALEAF